jgi:Putative Actinobacterial Holin-X, holin superfamily III
VLGVLGIAFVSAGKNKMKQVNAVPKRTAETLKENVEWAKQQIK